MAIPVLILGESGSGKTFSLKDLDHSRTVVMQTMSKRYPFKSAGWPAPVVTEDWERIRRAIHVAPTKGKDIVIVDDFQYLMANEFLHRGSEKGFNKFTEIAQHAWYVIRAAMEAEGDHRVYFLSHTVDDENGNTKIKTIGKLLDEKITIEGMFTIVLRAMISEGRHYFSTKNSGFDTVKSPAGLFVEDRIDNDLAAVDAAITDYYGITPLEQKS